MDFLKVKQEEMVELEAPQQMGLPNKLCNFGQVKLPALPQLLGGLAHISPIVTPWTLFPQQGLLSSQMIVPCLPNRFGSHISLPQMNPVAQPNAISFKFMFKNTGELKSQKDIKPDLPVPLDESQRRRKGEAKAEEDKNLQVRITPISEAGLLSFIYPMQSKFQYELKPLTSIPSEMYKDRNVSFKVELRRTDGEKVTNSALITVRLKLFTVENPPKEIKVNNDGSNFIRGTTSSIIYKGECRFDKLKMSDISSKYPGGLVHLVLVAEPFSSEALRDIGARDGELIRPMLLSNLRIKAKKQKI